MNQALLKKKGDLVRERERERLNGVSPVHVQNHKYI